MFTHWCIYRLVCLQTGVFTGWRQHVNTGTLRQIRSCSLLGVECSSTWQCGSVVVCIAAWKCSSVVVCIAAWKCGSVVVCMAAWKCNSVWQCCSVAVCMAVCMKLRQYGSMYGSMEVCMAICMTLWQYGSMYGRMAVQCRSEVWQGNTSFLEPNKPS